MLRIPHVLMPLNKLMVCATDISIAFAQSASSRNHPIGFGEGTCSVLDWLVISVTSAIFVALMYTSVWLFKFGLRSDRLARTRLGVTVASAFFAGIGIVFGTVSVLRWFECFFLMLNDIDPF